MPLLPNPSFRGWAIECCQKLHFSPTDPRCHGIEIWDKIGYNSACVREFCEIFAFIGGLRKWAIECCQIIFFRPTPVDDNEIRDKISYNSACATNITKILASDGGAG